MTARTWVCVPSGFYPVTCPFCLEAQPSNEHLSNHSYFECVQKPVEERAFTRKDHLKQHIQRIHHKGGNGKLKDVEDILKEWERQAAPLGLNSPALYCGFCGMRFREWEGRVAHVVWHFIQGLDLSSWWLGRKSKPQWAGGIRTWSCRFLLGVKSTFYCLKGQSLQWTCCACGSVVCEDVSWHDWDN